MRMPYQMLGDSIYVILTVFMSYRIYFKNVLSY